MMELLTKRNVLIISLISLAFFVVFVFLYEQELICGTWWACYDWILGFAYIFLCLFFLVFPFSLITLFLNRAVFESWKRFAVWGISAVGILTLIVAFIDTSGGSGLGGPSIDVAPLFLAPVYTLYFLASFIVIGKAWWAGRKGRVAE